MDLGTYSAGNMNLLEKFFVGDMNGIMGGLWGSLKRKIWAGRGWDKGIIGIITKDWDWKY